jgi:DNA-binding transcriptional LysR family regulator
LRDHLPEILDRLRAQFPSTRLILRSGYQPDLLEWMRKQELDLALTLLDKTAPPGVRVMPIMKLPLVLLASRKRRLRSLDELWLRKRVQEPLLCLPPNEFICRNFQDGLRALAVEWKPSIELSSLELIEAYVENDYGFGLSLAVPGKKFSRRIRVFPLCGFPEVEFGLVWNGEPTAFVKALMNEAQRRAYMLGGAQGLPENISSLADFAAPAQPSAQYRQTPPG